MHCINNSRSPLPNGFCIAPANTVSHFASNYFECQRILSNIKAIAFFVWYWNSFLLRVYLESFSCLVFQIEKLLSKIELYIMLCCSLYFCSICSPSTLDCHILFKCIISSHKEIMSITIKTFTKNLAFFTFCKMWRTTCVQMNSISYIEIWNSFINKIIDCSIQ